ncbi:hypothetical protein QUB08_10240 [Microcoleus sp. BR0-C5]|uniref:hypothetical protein n=1 Tax=Microcoleus sp. BR0-C5 TaxID=2818713 RepID=UPI002FD5E102
MPGSTSRKSDKTSQLFTLEVLENPFGLDIIRQPFEHQPDRIQIEFRSGTGDTGFCAMDQKRQADWYQRLDVV